MEEINNVQQLMTVKELGEYLRFTRRTIYSLLKRGDIPAIKIGNKWRFDKEVIDRWLQDNTERARLRILVIDDEPIVMTLFKETLEELGYTIVTAGSSAEGLEHFERDSFNLVFLDLKMPEMDGAELFGQIRRINPTVPVIIITGYPDSEIMARALEHGPFGVMTKPFDYSDIVGTVNNFMSAGAPGGKE